VASIAQSSVSSAFRQQRVPTVGPGPVPLPVKPAEVQVAGRDIDELGGHRGLGQAALSAQPLEVAAGKDFAGIYI
jgi:hypothetical protein